MSFPRYPDYKCSGLASVGNIPSNWTVKPVKAIAQLINGYPFESSRFNPNEGHPIVRIRDLGKAEVETRYSGDFLPEASIDNQDVLIGMDGDFNVGRWLGETPALLNQRVCCVRASNPSLTRYLEYALPAPLKRINEVTYATTVKHLSSLDVLRIKVSLPFAEEEIGRVVSFLDRETAKIDALIAEQQRLIELLQEKRQAVISHAVTKGLNPDAPMKDSGVEWLGEVPEHWDVLELKRLNKEGSSITYGIVQAGPHQEQGVPYIRTSDMSGDRLLLETCQRTSPEIDEAYARSRVSDGDLVIAIRATVGKALEVPTELDGANLTQGTAKFSPGERVTSGFMKLAFASFYCQTQIGSVAKGATFLEITLDALRRLAFAVPPKDEARQITHYLSERCAVLDTLTTNSEEACSLLKERRSALISAAVTGQIDVRGMVREAIEQ